MAVLLLVLNTSGYAQDTPSPAPAPAPAADVPAAPAQTEMQKWIATTDEQWQATLKRDVTDVHLTELEKLKQQYVASLEAAVTKASAAGDLDGAVALRNEEKRFAGTNLFPEQDEATDAATVKQIRVAVRAQIAKLEKDTAVRTKALHAKYDAYLGDAQARLTKAQRLEDALLVKAKREEVAAAWLAGANAVAANIETPKPPVVVPPRVVPVKPIAPVEKEQTSLTRQMSNTEWRQTEDTKKKFTLHPDGTSTANWNRRKGSWKVTGAHTLDLSVTNVHTIQKAKLNPEHTEIKMPNALPGEAPTTWTLIKK